MHAVDIANMTHGSKEVFGEMLKWLADVIGPQIREDSIRLKEQVGTTNIVRYD
jgi:hypothetical protein